MKTIKMVPVMGLLLTMIIACSKENPTQDRTEEQKDRIATPVVSISSDKAILYPSTIPTEIAFEIDSKADLTDVTISVPSTVSSQLSLSDDKRKGKAVLIGNGEFPETFSFTVKAFNQSGSTEASVNVSKAFIRTDRDNFSSKEAGSSFILEVVSNVSINVATDGSDWLHVENTGNSLFTITIDRNSTYTERTGKIIVSEPKNVLSKEVLIFQDASVNYYEKEVAALKALYEATDGPNWTKLSSTTGGLDISTENWCTDKPLNQWYGVELNPEGHVIYLHLTSMGLKGTLPEAIGDLIYCQELWLSGNSLNGPLPCRIGEMQSLKDLQADGMQLSGDLSASTLSDVASHMKCVSLSGNLFSGTFPEWVGDMPATSNFWLQGNCLSGKVPDKVKAHPRWSETVLDGSGKTVGQINMEQREGYTLTE